MLHNICLALFCAWNVCVCVCVYYLFYFPCNQDNFSKYYMNGIIWLEANNNSNLIIYISETQCMSLYWCVCFEQMPLLISSMREILQMELQWNHIVIKWHNVNYVCKTLDVIKLAVSGAMIAVVYVSDKRHIF